MKTVRFCLPLIVLCVAQLASQGTDAQFMQQGPKLVGADAVANGIQGGISVAVSADGSTAIVGASQDNNGVGAAWIFARSGGIWAQQGAKLVGTGAVTNAQQGFSVALSADGNTAIVGGPYDGAAWVYTRSGGVWVQQGPKLVGTGDADLQLQGWSVALSADGNTAIVGGPLTGGNGAALVFTRSENVWTQRGAELVGTGGSGGAYQGGAVALSADGNTAVVGGPDDADGVGATWVLSLIHI